MIQVYCSDAAATESLGARLAASLRPGDVILLAGGLGAGKTLFTKGIATGLGVEEPVVSPSFVLVRDYRSGFMPVIHVDVYRLGSLNEFEDLDVFELAREGVLVVEWGSAVEVMMPADHLRVEFSIESDDTRNLKFVGEGAWVERDLSGVA